MLLRIELSHIFKIDQVILIIKSKQTPVCSLIDHLTVGIILHSGSGPAIAVFERCL